MVIITTMFMVKSDLDPHMVSLVEWITSGICGFGFLLQSLWWLWFGKPCNNFSICRCLIKIGPTKI
jgi:hypothetical protein